jgi:acetyltransferase-like isoleucine patch superfamily enzyme
VRSRVAGFVDGIANLAMWIVKVGRAPVDGWLRLWRLGSLRVQAAHVPLSTQFDGPVRAHGSGDLRFGEHCRLGRDLHFDTADHGRIAIGDRVRINSGSLVVAVDGISIGDDTLVGEYVSIRDANHGTIAGSLIRSQPLIAEAIEIGRDVWLGRGCCILKGVCIGDGAVIGANSVVTGNVPPQAIYAGAPAKQIGIRR